MRDKQEEPGPVVPQQGPQQDGLEERERANFLLQIRVLKAIVEREGDPDKLACLASDIERWRVETQTALRNLRGMNKRVQREIRLHEQVERKLAALSASRTTQQDALTVQDWLTADRIEQTLTTIGFITTDDAKWLLGQLTKLGRAVHRLSASRIDPPVPSTPRQIIKAAFVEGFSAGVARPEMGTESAWQESQAVRDSVMRSAAVVPPPSAPEGK